MSYRDTRRLKARENAAWLKAYKETHGCTDCGISDWRVLEFDHLPEHEKSFKISASTYSARSTLEREIAKCEVVCANCHRLRTIERLNIKYGEGDCEKGDSPPKCNDGQENQAA